MVSYVCLIIITLPCLAWTKANQHKTDKPDLDRNRSVHDLMLEVTIERNNKEYDEVAGKLSLNGYFGIQWIDKTVSWDPAEYGVSSITFNDELFWKPTFSMSNPYGALKILYKDDSVKRAHSTGQMDWFPSGSFDITCQADVSDYPFDTQTCTLAFVLSGYSDKEVILWPTAFMTDWYVPHKTWDLVEVNMTRTAFPQVANFHMKLRRKPLFFVFNLILPIVLMCLLNPFVFFLPADSGERVGFSITVLLAIAVFLTISASSLPAISEPRLPLISILLFADVAFSGIIVIFVIISLRFYLRSENIPVSYLWGEFVKICRILKCGCRCTKRERDNDKVKEYKYKNGENDNFSISKIKLYSSENQYRGTDSIEINSILSKDEITWKNVGEELDFVFGTISALYMVTAHVLYILDAVIDLSIFT
ncbi:unnamed protein product [Mytilus edulis]|uniref:Uncharacterized protein n=1 Tax=Mytilus edulis TaxID=6550 RepID=A0A8S3UT83_MYTED|nr:unnamed protein product [Mytilus edulis]